VSKIVKKLESMKVRKAKARNQWGKVMTDERMGCIK
jgi:hypothetical protein